MILAPALAGDAEALAALHALAFEAPWSASEIADLLGGPGAFALAVTDTDGPDTGSLAGFILCRTMADEAEILTLTTAPGRRRRGVARALLEAATQVALGRGATALFLEVATDNAAARALYGKSGFVAVGAKRGYYQRGDRDADAIVLRRDLNR